MTGPYNKKSQGSLRRLSFLKILLVFDLYLTDMARLFADDTSLSFSSTILAVIERVVNHDLFTLKEWATKWLITFHPQKTEVMLISNIFNDYNLEIKSDTNVLKIVDARKHF